jgi:Ca2+-binding EF-hand superfamily protein/predicted  nucleic acid-binding Zn-ribbon protein
MSVLAHTKHLNKAVVRGVFRKYNSTNDVVNVSQLPSVLIDLGLPEEILDEATVQALSHVMDNDQSGTVEFNEMFDWWTKMASTGVENLDTRVVNIGRLYNLVCKYDTSGNAILDRYQFQQMWLDMGNEEKELAQIFEVIDKNKDNSISFLELALVFGFIDGQGQLSSDYFAKLWTDTSVMEEIVELSAAPVRIPMIKKRSESHAHTKKYVPQSTDKIAEPSNKELQTLITQLRADADDANRKLRETENKLLAEKQRAVTDVQLLRNQQKESLELRREVEKLKDDVRLRGDGKGRVSSDVLAKNYDALLTEFREYRIKKEISERDFNEQLRELREKLAAEHRRTETAEALLREFKAQCKCKDVTVENFILKDQIRKLQDEVLNEMKRSESPRRTANPTRSPRRSHTSSPRSPARSNTSSPIRRGNLSPGGRNLISPSGRTLAITRNGYSPPKSAWSRVHSLVGCSWRQDYLPKEFHFSGDRKSVKCSGHPSESDYMIVGNMSASPGVSTYWEVESWSQEGDAFYVGAVADTNSTEVHGHTGWMLRNDGFLFNSGQQVSEQYCKPFGHNAHVGVLLDLRLGQITFFLNSESLGVAFKNVSGTVRPAVIHCAKYY